MPIYTIAEYRVRPEAVGKVKAAIEEFVHYVKANEPRTRLYAAWQEEGESTSFVHFFIFEDEAAHKAHGESAAVKRFEAVYAPELVGGPVRFTDYRLVAAQGRLE
ncbi:MAG TPA: antibiotic biosynthesis monooxygenase [Rectinemataceae bacterium]|nr:antibiotic biosynthesis monooxygenase [Rectinemataceae bacterium]